MVFTTALLWCDECNYTSQRRAWWEESSKLYATGNCKSMSFQAWSRSACGRARGWVVLRYFQCIPQIEACAAHSTYKRQKRCSNPVATRTRWLKWLIRTNRWATRTPLFLTGKLNLNNKLKGKYGQILLCQYRYNPVPESGLSRGLTLVLDAHTDLITAASIPDYFQALQFMLSCAEWQLFILLILGLWSNNWYKTELPRDNQKESSN